ncbi:MAG: PxKF domain-containing protein [Nitrospirota bacterium]
MARTKIRYLLTVFLGFSVFIFSMPLSAEMPEYERLQPVTAGLGAPTAVAPDSYGNLYVTDLIDGRLLVYDLSDGSLKKQIQGLDRPISVAVYGDNRVYVGLRGRGSIAAYDAELNYLDELGSGYGEFKNPNAIATGSDGKVYVADGKENKIKVYHPDGSSYFSFGSTGNGNGQFNFPSSIAIDEANAEIIVSDFKRVYNWMWGWSSGARIQVFEMNGSFKRSFGVFGVGEGKMFRPMGVEVDSERRLYIADVFQNVVLVYDHTGTYLGTVYDLDSPMRTPLDLAISGNNRIYVASQNTAKVEVFSILGADAEPPATSISLSGSTGNNGWYVSDVRITLMAVDNEGGSGVLKTEYSVDNAVWNDYTVPFMISDEGSTVVYYRSTDNEGNIETVKSEAVKIDKTMPQISITSPADGASYLLHQSVIVEWSVTDELSGIASSSGTTANGSALDTSVVGSHDFTVSAADNAGNSDSLSVEYSVVYASPNPDFFLPPVRSDRVFKLGSTVPVKFQLTDANGAYISTAAATIALQKYSGEEPFGEPLDAASTSGADTGSLFRYDSIASQYIYNLSTEALSRGIWQIRVTLDDGSIKTVMVGFK